MVRLDKLIPWCG